MAINVSLKELIESGAHFGHQAKRWNPKMEKYLYGEKDGVHIFDLTKTKPLLEEALEYLQKSAKEGKHILFVGTKKQAKEEIKEKALAAQAYYINERWLGGTLTNFDQLQKSLRKMNDIRKGLETGEYKNYTKKERLLLQREKERLERFFGGVDGMTAIPEILVIVDTKREKTAIREAEVKGVETVAIVDSNTDPDEVDYPIPMNDDASRALEYVLGLIRDAIMAGKGIKAPEKEKSEKTKISTAKPKAETK